MIGRMADRFPFVQIGFFDDSAAMIDALGSVPLDDVALISLDHDLEMIPGTDQRWIDPGTGLEVARWLAGLEYPTCPVVIHTTNSPASDRMMRVLEEAHWKVFRVVPHNDLEWVDSDWFPVVRNAIVDYSPRPSSSTDLPATNRVPLFRSLLDSAVLFIGRKLSLSKEHAGVPHKERSN